LAIDNSPFAVFHHSPFAIRDSQSFSIRHSLFAIRRLFRFAVFHCSLLAIRNSHSFSIRHSLFAIRRFPRSLLAARGSPSFASRHSPSPRPPFLPFGSDRPCVSERFPSEVRGGCGERSRRGLVLHRARAAVLAQVSI
jgi:hypothetical protein